MNIGLRSVLLLAAVVLFVLEAVGNDSDLDLLALGLAAFAASFVVDGRGFGFGRRR